LAKVAFFSCVYLIQHLTLWHNRMSDRGHGDDGPPVGVEHRLEGGLLVLLLEDVDERGEHDGAHAEEEEE
jgi:hypothetical protein